MERDDSKPAQARWPPRSSRSGIIRPILRPILNPRRRDGRTTQDRRHAPDNDVLDIVRFKQFEDSLEALRRHRLTVSVYYRMAEVGILAPDARVELIDGEIFDIAPPASLHAATVRHGVPQQGSYTQVDEPDLSAPIEISALCGVAVELQLLFGG